MTARFKPRTITPVDAVRWDGTNLAEVRAICAEVQQLGTGTILSIPVEDGFAEVYVGDLVMRNLGTGKYSKLTADIFYALYELQPI
jgi:hypothetical protein